MINRRGFMSSLAAAAAVPAVGLSASPSKNWRCIIGGNRCGKSTKAAEIAMQSDLVICVASDSWHYDHSMRRIAKSVDSLIKHNTKRLYFSYASGLCLCTEDNLRDYYLTVFGRFPELTSRSMWIDESVPFGIEKVADLFDCVVLSSWPNGEIADTPFYQECERMGTVEFLKASCYDNRKDLSPAFVNGMNSLSARQGYVWHEV